MATTRRVTVSTTLTPMEKEVLEKLADEWGVKPGCILRRLILFLLQKRISFIELMQEPVDKEYILVKKEDFFKSVAYLSTREKEQLVLFAKSWDCTVSAVLRRLVRALLFGAIPKDKIWG